jgi:hypothetical protein
MKDAKGHGSAAHQGGVEDASKMGAFHAFKAATDAVNAEWSAAAAVLNAFPRGAERAHAGSRKGKPGVSGGQGEGSSARAAGTADERSAYQDVRQRVQAVAGGARRSEDEMKVALRSSTTLNQGEE